MLDFVWRLAYSNQNSHGPVYTVLPDMYCGTALSLWLERLAQAIVERFAAPPRCPPITHAFTTQNHASEQLV